MKQIKVYTEWTAPKGKKENVHQEIYEYDYIDRKTGEVVHKKINTQEKIQSNLAKTDYKKMIMMGEIPDNGRTMEPGLRDYTVIPGNKADFIDFVTKVSNMDAEALNKMVEQFTKALQPQPNQNGEEDSETDATTTQTQPNNSGIDPETNESGEQ